MGKQEKQKPKKIEKKKTIVKKVKDLSWKGNPSAKKAKLPEEPNPEVIPKYISPIQEKLGSIVSMQDRIINDQEVIIKRLNPIEEKIVALEVKAIQSHPSHADMIFHREANVREVNQVREMIYEAEEKRYERDYKIMDRFLFTLWGAAIVTGTIISAVYGANYIPFGLIIGFVGGAIISIICYGTIFDGNITRDKYLVKPEKI